MKIEEKGKDKSFPESQWSLWLVGYKREGMNEINEASQRRKLHFACLNISRHKFYHWKFIKIDFINQYFKAFALFTKTKSAPLHCNFSYN